MMVNGLDNLKNHCSLGGHIFKRKAMDPKKLTGLGYFGAAALSYLYWPYLAMYLGQTGTTLAMTSACLAGITYLGYREPTINTIGFIREGEHQGKLEISF